MLFIGIQMEDQVYKTAQLVHAGLIVLPALFPLLGVLSVVACVCSSFWKIRGQGDMTALVACMVWFITTEAISAVMVPHHSEWVFSHKDVTLAGPACFWDWGVMWCVLMFLIKLIMGNHMIGKGPGFPQA